MEKEEPATVRAERVSDRAAGALTQGRLPLDETAATRDKRWTRLLSGGSPREILSRLVQGDPLGVRRRLARVLAEEALLVDADRAHLRTLARCAREAVRYGGKPELDEWLDARVREALSELVREDAEAVRAGAPAEDGSAFDALARPLGLDATRMRQVCTSFNRLAVADRRAFFGCVIGQRSLDELAHESRVNGSEVARRARRALDVVLAGELEGEES